MVLMRALLVVALVLSGCAAPLTEDAAPAASLGAIINDGGCTAASINFEMDRSAVDPWLPSGFHPRVGYDNLGTEISSANAMVSMTTWSCQETRFGTMAIHVERPAVDASLPPVGYHLYTFAEFSDDDNVAAALVELGRPALVGTAQVSIEALGVQTGEPIQTEQINLAWDQDGSLAAAQGVTLTRVEDALTARHWHQSDAITHLDVISNAAIRFGPGTCDIDDNHPAAAMLPDLTCTQTRAWIASYGSTDLRVFAHYATDEER